MTSVNNNISTPPPRDDLRRRPNRVHSTPGRTSTLMRILAFSAQIELRSSFRSAEFAIGAVAVPVMLYAMFGLRNGDSELPGGPMVALAMFVSIACYGVVSLAIFVFGEDVAKERGRGWPRTMAATPLSPGVHLAGKSVSAVVHGMLIVVAMGAVAAAAGGVRMASMSRLALGATLVSGVVLFSTLGFAIAYLARPRAATVIANLVFLPLSFASGFFFPLGELPEFVGMIAEWLPTYHFGQLAYRTVMPASDVEFWVGAAAQPLWVHLAWVVGSAAVLGLVTVIAARRESVTRRG